MVEGVALRLGSVGSTRETWLGDWRRENRQDCLARQVKNSPLPAYPAYHIVIFQWVRTARGEFEA